MALKKSVDGAWEDCSSVNKPVDGAWESCEVVNKPVDGAWEKVWPMERYLIKDSVGIEVDDHTVLTHPSLHSADGIGETTFSDGFKFSLVTEENSEGEYEYFYHYFLGTGTGDTYTRLHIQNNTYTSLKLRYRFNTTYIGDSAADYSKFVASSDIQYSSGTDAYTSIGYGSAQEGSITEVTLDVSNLEAFCIFLRFYLVDVDYEFQIIDIWLE